MQGAVCLDTSSELEYEPGSYRDRNGKVFYVAGDVYRALSVRALREWESLASKDFFHRAAEEGKIVRTVQIDPAQYPGISFPQNWAAFLKHQAIPFVTYPYEWSFSMLKDAALLQLELLDAAVNEGMVLKDGSAFNVQWIGARPIFIDIPSFENLAPGEAWVGYRQFCQTCLYPLFLQAYKDISFQPWLRGSLDGIEPKLCKHLMSFRDLFRRGVVTHVHLHAMLEARYAHTQKDVQSELRSAGFSKELIRANARRLAEVVRHLKWKAKRSTWSDYTVTNSYTDADRDRKEDFVRDVVRLRHRKLVWDLGSNTGNFSRIAAENSSYVVAMDSDHLAVDRLYQALKAEGNEQILPLVSNLIDASPNMGWRGTERKGLTERGRPDLTLCLALIHHVVIGANVPLQEFVAWLAALGSDLVIEFVTKDDPMVQTLLRHKRDDYSDYSVECFEHCLSNAFDVTRRETINSGTRTLYHAIASTSKLDVPQRR